MAKVVPPKPASVTPPEDEPAPRISVQLTKDGNRIDWDQMRGSTRERLSALGILDPAKGKPAAKVDAETQAIFEQWCGLIYDALGSVSATWAMRATGASSEQASVMLYTAEQKRALVPPTVRLLDKYGSTWLTKYGDELTLAATISMVTMGNFQKLRASIRGPAEVVNIRQAPKSDAP